MLSRTFIPAPRACAMPFVIGTSVASAAHSREVPQPDSVMTVVIRAGPVRRVRVLTCWCRHWPCGACPLPFLCYVVCTGRGRVGYERRGRGRGGGVKTSSNNAMFLLCVYVFDGHSSSSCLEWSVIGAAASTPAAAGRSPRESPAASLEADQRCRPAAEQPRSAPCPSGLAPR